MQLSIPFLCIIQHYLYHTSAAQTSIQVYIHIDLNSNHVSFDKNQINIRRMIGYNCNYSYQYCILYWKTMKFNLTINKMNCELMLTYDTHALQQTGCRNPTGQKNASHDMGYLYKACDQISDFCH